MIEQETTKPGTLTDMLAFAVTVWVLKLSSQIPGFPASEFVPCISPGFLVSCSNFDFES
jgi:hypothetical protein